MKANGAPEKIYCGNNGHGNLSYSNLPFPNAVEYCRTDAFIEKACDAYCKVCKMPNCRRTECNWISDFKEHLKTI